jgi:phage terminase large subunit-like protein
MPAPHSSSASLASLLAKHPNRTAILATLSEAELEFLGHDPLGPCEWSFWARPNQLPPPGNWTKWLILAGRGFGKTRSIVEFVQAEVEAGRARRIGIAGATASDVRDVLVEGVSGFLAVSRPWNRPVYEPSKTRLTWPNGARARLYSADEPDRFRGPGIDLFVADELAAWRYPDAWDQAMFSLRVGKHPRAVIATTPRPTALIRDLLKREGQDVVVSRGSTYDNRPNLAAPFLTDIVRRYEGTRLGRQELDGELLDDAPGALWKRAQLDEPGFRVLDRNKLPDMTRVVVAVDPAVSANDGSDETGIVVVGLGDDGLAYVLEDGTLSSATPNEWARQVVALYRAHKADRVIAEVNNGGDLVEANVRNVEPTIPFTQVRATRGKAVRAEPISALYEQKRVKHLGVLAKLEDQMCTWDPGIPGKSPDRVDALVWALTELAESMNGSVNVSEWVA